MTSHRVSRVRYDLIRACDWSMLCFARHTLTHFLNHSYGGLESDVNTIIDTNRPIGLLN
jgi:hypothetical protein